MSTAPSLPSQLAVLAPQGSSLNTSDSDSKGVFGGLLSGELTAATDVIGLKEAIANLVIEVAELPSSGNSLPTDINVQLESAIVEQDVIEAELAISANIQIPLSIPVQNSGFGIESNITQSSVALPQTTDTLRSFIGNNQNILLAKPVDAKLTASLAVLTETDLEPETLLMPQVKQSNLLQNSLSLQTRSADIGVEAGQIARVVEQFSEFTQRATPATSSTLSALMSSVTTASSESNLVPSSSTVAQLSVDVPIQDKRWQKAFAQRVLWSVGNNQSVQLRIHPAELGRIDIQVNVENDKASVVFNTQSSMVKEAIELALPRLREMLAEQGVDLVDVDINHDDINQQQADADENSDKQASLHKDLSATATDDDSVKQRLSHIIIDDDAIDYYV